MERGDPTELDLPAAQENDIHRQIAPEDEQAAGDVVHDPVSASYFYHLISSKNTRGWLLRPSPY